MKNESLDKIAKKVLDNTKIDIPKDYSFDPITILMIISIILTLIRIIQECRKKRTLIKNKTESANLMKRDIQEIVLKDSWFNRRRLQRVIKQHLSKDQFKVYNTALQDSIMDVGINLTDDEVYTLMENIQ